LGEAHEKSWSKTTCGAPVLPSHHRGRARRILTSGGTEMAFTAWIDYLSPGEQERSGICAALIRCISHL